MSDLTRLYNFAAGTTIVSEEVDAELDQIIAKINDLTNDNISASAAIEHSKLATQPACKATRDAVQNIANATTTTVLFNAEDYDTDGMHSIVTNTERVTIQAGDGGLYRVDAFCQWDGLVTPAGNRLMVVTKNGAADVVVGDDRQANTMSTFGTRMCCGTDVRLAAGDWVQMSVRQDHGSAIDLDDVWLSVRRVGE